MKINGFRNVVLLLLGMTAMGLQTVYSAESFAGLEAIEAMIDYIPSDRKTMVIGDRSFAVSPLITVRYEDGAVSSAASLKIGQRVKVYFAQGEQEAYQAPPEAKGIEIMQSGVGQ